MLTKALLHVGCGPQNRSSLKGFAGQQWHEIRLDIDASVAPDVVGSLTDMSAVDAGSVDAVYSAHNLEHLYPHEVPLALKEMHRVLKDDGFLVLTCPDLQSVCAEVAKGKLTEPLYTSPAGPIAPLDILYGHQAYMAQGNLYMAHRCGFTLDVLASLLEQARFSQSIGVRRPKAYDLWLMAFKSQTPELRMRELAPEYLP